MPKTPSDKTGITRKRGAAPGKRNQRAKLRHGLRAGSLPKDAKFIEVRLNFFRRQLEDAVLASKGEISLPDAGCIQSACRWERHACLCQRWMVKKTDELKAADLLKFSESIGRASDCRDKAIRTLGLDAKPLAPWLTLDVSKENDDDE